MFITKSNHKKIVSNLENEIQKLKNKILDVTWERNRFEENSNKLIEIQSNHDSKLNNYLIVIGPDSQVDVKGHYFEIDDNSLTVYRYDATGRTCVFHCNKFDYIVTSE